MAPPKNPDRVPNISQVVDPVGRDPEGHGPARGRAEGMPIMPKIATTGIYRRKDGGPSIFYREGHELLPEEMDKIELVEPADRSKGAPEKREEKPAGDSPAHKAKVAKGKGA